MNITNKTVLITGGGSGIGLEIARLLSTKNNKVIITSRNADKLQKAAAGLANVTAIASDLTDKIAVNNLITKIKTDFGGLDILINNAGNVYVYKLGADVNAAEKAVDEFNTNFFSVLNLTEQLLPTLSASAEAAVVNVTSIVALVPGINIPTYSASKAALRSYTQSLRLTLKDTTVKVFELMPPLVNTEFSKEIGGENGISPAQVAQDLITAFEQDKYEIHVGGTADIYALTLKGGNEAFNELNQSR